MSQIPDDYKLPLSYYKEISFLAVKSPELLKRYYALELYDCFSRESLGK